MGENGKKRRITNLRRSRKLRAGGSERKRRESRKSTQSYAELFGETKAEFDARESKGK